MKNATRSRAMLLVLCLTTLTGEAGKASERASSTVESGGKAASRIEGQASVGQTPSRLGHGRIADALPLQSQAPRPLEVDVRRDPMKNELTLALRGGLTSRLISETEVMGSTFQLFVYPDAEAAEQDRLNEGNGSLFFGEVTLGTRLHAKGGLSRGDFTIERPADGAFVARAFEAGTTVIRVPNEATAVVRLIAGPERVMPVEADSAAADESVAKPAITMMWDPRPNPARQGVTFRFSLSHRLPAKLTLFDVQGRRVKTLINRVLDAGPQDFTWDRTDSKGNHSKSGMYFARFEADNKSFTKRFVLVR